MRAFHLTIVACVAVSAQVIGAPLGAVAPKVSSPAVPTAASIEAVGVVRAHAADHSVAILRSDGRTRVLAVGEVAFGARLVAIEGDVVTIEIDGRRTELRLSRSTPAAAAAVAPPRPAPLPADAPPEDPATPARDMDKRQVQIRLGEEMNRILTETAMAPVMEDGRVVGVQLTRLAEGSLLTDAGLRAGDVLSRINDVPIDGMATLIGLWPRLQSATELRAVVVRGGQPVSLRVVLR